MVREALRERLLEALKECGGSAGNGRLREILGWQDETYWQIRDTLIEEGAITAGRASGRNEGSAGGARRWLRIRRTSPSTSLSPTPSPHNVATR